MSQTIRPINFSSAPNPPQFAHLGVQRTEFEEPNRSGRGRVVGVDDGDELASGELVGAPTHPIFLKLPNDLAGRFDEDLGNVVELAAVSGDTKTLACFRWCRAQ